MQSQTCYFMLQPNDVTAGCPPGSHGWTRKGRHVLLTICALVWLVLGLVSQATAAAQTPLVGSGEEPVLDGLAKSAIVQIAPDGRVFVARKNGLIEVFDNISDTTSTVFADLRSNVYTFGKGGVVGMALDPAFPTDPYVYVLYSYSAASTRLSRLRANGNVMTGAEQVVVADWSQRYPGEPVSGLAFGPDNLLYVSAGEGAISRVVDFRQDDKSNTDPVNEAAASAQDLGTAVDPLTLNGSISSNTENQSPQQVNSLVVGDPTVDANGVKSYPVTSVFQGSQPTTLRILEPTNPAPGIPRRLLYVMPVVAGVTNLGSTHSDGLEELRLLDVHNRYNVTLIAPSFHIDPWYGDHVSNPDRRLESFIIQDLVPFGDSFGAPGGTPERWVLGFSKSGRGALSLIFRNSSVFNAAAAWDSPAQLTDMSGFEGLQENFGTEANFDAYEIPSLVAANAAAFGNHNRIWISGDESAWTSHMTQLHSQMVQAGVIHSWIEGGPRAHSWGSGWLEGAVASLSANANPVVPGPGPVAAYNFSEGSGSSVGDATGNGHTGDISGATWTAEGRVGNALSFDGSNDWVTVNATSLLDLTTGMTVEAWVFPTTTSGSRNVLIKEGTNRDIYNLYARSGGSKSEIYAFIGGANRSAESTPLPANVWTHIAGTYDGAALRLYVNGVQVAINNLASGSILTSTGPLRIGGNSIWGEFFQGRIDEVRIYNRALTQAEIQLDMNALVDTTAPVRSNGLPTGILGAGTTQATLSLATDENATCRYATSAGVAYGSMPNVFTTTGGAAHSTTVSGLTDGGSYSFFVRCQDTAGNANSTDFNISFSVAEPGQDTTAPVRSNGAPSGSLGSGTTQTTMSLTTDENASCRYATSAGVAYGSMANVFTTTGGTGHSTTVSGLTDGGSYSFFVRCQDVAGNPNSNDFSISFSVAQPVGTGLVAAYGFSEGSGSSVGDASGNGHVGAISGASWSTQGKYGNALSFDGVNDWVTVNDTSLLDLTTGMTVEAWVFPTTTNGSRNVLIKEGTNRDIYNLYSRSGGSKSEIYAFIGGANRSAESTPLPANVWTHIAGTYDGAALRLYVNGVQVAINNLASGSILTSTGPLRIGGNSIWGEFFQGRIDEVRIYNRALTQAEIQLDMNALVDTTAPVRSNGLPTGILGAGTTQATLSLATDENATCRYATSAGVAYGSMPNVFTTTGGAAHSTTVSGLTDGGSYSFFVRCQDTAGNANSTDFNISFSVAEPGQDTTAPVRSNGAPSGSLGSGTTQTTMSLTTDENASCRYATSAGVAYGSMANVFTTTGGTGHSTTVSGLTDGGSYSFFVRCQDVAGNPNSNDFSISFSVAQPVGTGLVAAYGFSEGSGSSVGDATGNGHVGAISGASWSTQGKYGNALSFDGVNDWVTVNDTSLLDLTTGMTVEAWVFPTTTNGSRNVLIKEGTNRDIYNLYARSGGSKSEIFAFIGGANRSAESTPLPANVWTHIAGTYDGAALRLYVNGVQVAINNLASGSILTSTGPLRIGGNSIWGEFFQGRIDEVRIYNRALTQAEIQLDMNALVDTTAPVRSNGLPTGILGAGTTQATLSLATDENATCRYATSAGVAYGSMPNVFTTTGGAAHSTTVSGLTDGGSYSFFVRCQDTAGNANSSDFNISFSVAEPGQDTTAPVRSNGAPSGSLGSGTTQTTMSLTTDENASCRYATSAGVAYGSMPNTFTTTGGTGHSTTVSGLTDGGSYSFFVRCQDVAGNPNSNDFSISFSVAQPVGAGLVAAYGFSEGGGFSVGDATGNGHVGAISGASWSTQGKYGNALSFDGVNDLVTVNDTSLLDLTTGMTVEAWVFPTTTNGSRNVLIKEGTNRDIYNLYSRSGGSKSEIYAFIGGANRSAESTPLPANVWTHIAGTYDGAALRLYVNGVQVAINNLASGSILTSTGPLRIGGNSFWGEFFQGRIDEIRIYNRALSAAEIQTDMAAPVN